MRAAERKLTVVINAQQKPCIQQIPWVPVWEILVEKRCLGQLLAMKIGSKYRFGDVRALHQEQVALATAL